MSADLFARTKIEPGALVQTLDLDSTSAPSAGKGECARGGLGPAGHSAGAAGPSLRAPGPEQGSVALHAFGSSLFVEKVRFTQVEIRP